MEKKHLTAAQVKRMPVGEIVKYVWTEDGKQVSVSYFVIRIGKKKALKSVFSGAITEIRDFLDDGYFVEDDD